VHDVAVFGAWILLVASAVAVALFTTKLAERTSVPFAAPFLVIAAVASDIFPSLDVSTATVVRVATVALIVILFDGGLGIGWRRLRYSLVPVASLERSQRPAAWPCSPTGRSGSTGRRPGSSAPQSRPPIRP
jgi:NhaP-type Na+/H+ and K+/H+ antiporter